MKTYRKAEAIVTQYNQDLAEWEQAVKNGQKPRLGLTYIYEHKKTPCKIFASCRV